MPSGTRPRTTPIRSRNRTSRCSVFPGAPMTTARSSVRHAPASRARRRCSWRCTTRSRDRVRTPAGLSLRQGRAALLTALKPSGPHAIVRNGMATATALEIITVDSPRASVLRRRAKPLGKVTRDVQRLLEDMLATMHAANGLGLAAPQVGESVRALVAQVQERIVYLVDPEIVSAGDEEIATEACLSIPGVIGDVPRAVIVTVKGKNR